MTNFELFKEVYIEHTFAGERTNRRNLVFCLKDENKVDEVLNNLFVECPTKFPGEIKTEKHYLLKKKWEVLHSWFYTIDIIKHEPKKTFKFIWWFIRELCYINRNWKFYMHPTQINR